jgi:hypothetical protein
MSGYNPPATPAGDVAITTTITGAVLTDSAGANVDLSGTWTTYYDIATGGIDNNQNAYLDIDVTGAEGTRHFFGAYATPGETVSSGNPLGTGYQLKDNASSGDANSYQALYMDWFSETPTSLTGEDNSFFTSLQDFVGNSYTLTNDGVVTHCFTAGTAITTPAGAAAIETLAPGDLVTLADGSTTAIRWIGRRTIATRFADPMQHYPVRIKAGALGEGLPLRDLEVSPCHAMLVDGLLVHAAAMINGISIFRVTPAAENFIYYHIELATHGLILAEGAASESFVDNVGRMGFDNWAEHEALCGDAPIAELDLPRVKTPRQLPEAIRNILHARAQTLYGITRAA